MPPSADDPARPDASGHGLPSRLDPRGRHRNSGQPSTVWPRVRIGIKAISVLASLALLLGFAYAWWNYRDLNSNLRRLDVAVGADQGQPGQPDRHDVDGKDQNILIVGNDDRSNMTDAEVRELKTGRDGGSLATDTMMVVHVPANGDKATLISFPRDAYVAIPGHGMNKLNAAYANGYTDAGGSADAKRAAGANLLIQTIQNLTGLTIDHFVQVDLIGFYRISKAIGPVTVNLCHAVNDPRYSHLVMSAGKHDIEGVQALEFVRQRHNLPNETGDLGRAQRQRYFLAAAFRKIASAGTLLSPGRLHKLISAIDRSLYVDSHFDILSLAGQISDLSANNIVGKTIPFEHFQDTEVGSVEIVDPDRVKRFVNNLLHPVDDELESAKPVEPESVTVKVVNAGTVNHAARQNAALLAQQGFHTSYGSHDGQVAKTTIEYAAGMEAQAKTLATYVPGATFKKTDVSTLTLVLGADGHTAKAPGSSSAPTTKAPTSAKPKTKPVDAGCIN